MNILLVAATANELKPTLDYFGITPNAPAIQTGKHRLSCLIAGVGMVATAFALGRQLAANKYDLAVNAGIAGSFDPAIPLGQVLHITDDTFAELGAEDGDAFLSIDALGYGTALQHPVSPNFNQPLLEQLPKASAITVNKVHGSENSISQTKARLKPQLESMEGAAFFYACNQFATPAVQIRAVSNRVERRNRDNWNIGLAITNLNDFLIRFMEA